MLHFNLVSMYCQLSHALLYSSFRILCNFILFSLFLNHVFGIYIHLYIVYKFIIKNGCFITIRVVHSSNWQHNFILGKAIEKW